MLVKCLKFLLIGALIAGCLESIGFTFKNWEFYPLDIIFIAIFVWLELKDTWDLGQ